MEKRERLSRVLNDLIELQWACTDGEEYKVYENMIKEVASVIKK